MARAVDIISGAGVENAAAIVAASNNTGLPLGVAMGMVMKETGGANVYGHDAGGACSGWGQVTQDNFRNNFLPVVLAGGTSNGVGPTQITYPGYFRQNPSYPWWDPYANCVVGFNLLKGYCGGDYSHGSLVAAGSTYNSGSPTGTASTYGETFASLAEDWTERLAGADATVDIDNLGEEDMPSAGEIAQAILDATVVRDGLPGDDPRSGKEVSLRAIAAWHDAGMTDLASRIDAIPGAVWTYEMTRQGLPEDDPRAGGTIQAQTILRWADAIAADVKSAVVDAVRQLSGDEAAQRVADAISARLAELVHRETAEPGTVAAAGLAANQIVVQAGQTLKQIAEAHGTTVQGIVDATPGLNPNDLVAGQKVCIPAKSE